MLLSFAQRGTMFRGDRETRITGRDEPMARRAKDLGKITLRPSGKIRVSTVHVFEFTYTAGRNGLAEGGGIRILLPGSHSWSKPQVAKQSQFAGYVHALTDDGRCLVRARNISRGYRGDAGQIVDTSTPAKLHKAASNAVAITVEKGRLPPGGKIRIMYGSAWHGIGYGVRTAHRIIQSRQNANRFDVSVDVDGSGKFVDLDKSPEVILVPDEPDHLDVLLSARGAKGKLNIRINDRWSNAIPNHTGKVELTVGRTKIRKRIKTNRKGVAKVDLDIAPRRPIRVTAVLDGKVQGRSNPLPPADALGGMNLYWGDLHVHTSYSDDNHWVTVMPATPVEICQYARDVAGLDFIAITDHHNVYKTWTRQLARQAWDASNDCAAAVTREGKFIAFAGMEYRCARGDTCFIFLNPGVAPYCDPRIDAVQKAWKLYEGFDFLSIPHHHNDDGTWDEWRYRNDDVERLVEICSGHGRFEFRGNIPHFPRRMHEGFHDVQTMLNAGRRVGVIGSSDNHTGHPGEGPLAGVYARSLRSEDIWEALRCRRCYATTHARIVVDFRIDGAPMGSQIQSPPDNPRKLQFRVWGTAPILAAEIIRNGKIIRAKYNTALDVNLSLRDRCSSKKTDYYYARILQTDGEMAWSSPIWVTERQETR